MTIHSVTTGTTEPQLVFVHGLTCDHTDWYPQVETFSDEARCTCVDLRGHGKSSHLGAPHDIGTLAKDVIDACQHNGIESAVFVGHSMGTRVVASLAGQAIDQGTPELVKALVFVDGSKQAEGDISPLLDAIKAQCEDRDNARQFIRNLFEPMFNHKSDAAQRRRIQQRAENISPTVFQQLLCGMLSWDATCMEKTLKSLSQPLYVVQSTTLNEDMTRVAMQAHQSSPYLDLIRDCVADVSIDVINGTGHFAQLEAPDRVNQAIRNALDHNHDATTDPAS